MVSRACNTRLFKIIFNSAYYYSTCVVVADFVLVYTVLRRDVACRMECSRLRPGNQIWLCSQYKIYFLSLQHVERR
jgi:hypothetical protein